MKKLFLFYIFLFFCSGTFAQNKEKPSSAAYTILLTGASFASPENGWFELGCKALNATPINRAIGGEAIADAANRMAAGTLYSKKELEKTDAFVIMQVHDKDVYDTTQLKENYTDYKIPFDRSNYAAAYDYVIKRYITECYNLKFDSTSIYYKSPYGKPAVIVFSTHWHDARVTYNTSIRKLAEKWGFPLIEFDKYIGFSKNALHPVTKKQYSLIYGVGDTQQTDGVTYGWHPIRGNDSFIQQRMAAIFVDTMRKILPIK
ncbi:conserved exported hypothetical protein [uncultured Paludibacter sp.]|uniref:DUF5040 domain-containing protein n=1 Tax=uncultured Paludibacter sp. TaxID=497635 RepID=A0A653AJH5_9BACT|nr:conserved exported hypothetical protein [uncultured Paludibacter sp.]